MKTILYKRHIAFHIGDVLLVSFSDKPSRFQVVEVNKRKNILKIEVLEDHYKDPFQVGAVVDIGTQIFKKYWFFNFENR
jgi:hypothetical protein